MKRHGQEEFYMSNHRIAAKESPECSHTIIFDKKVVNGQKNMQRIHKNIKGFS